MIEGIRKAFRENRYVYNLHAVDQSILRFITRYEIMEAIENGEIIENYPKDKFGPSCFIFGRTYVGRPLHIQCSYPSRPLVKIITVKEEN